MYVQKSKLDVKNNGFCEFFDFIKPIINITTVFYSIINTK